MTTTQAVRAGNLIFVGGQMSLDAQGRVVGSDITTQARNVFEAMKRVLADAGGTMADVVKHNVYFHCDGDEPRSRSSWTISIEFASSTSRIPGRQPPKYECGLDREGALLLVDAWAVVGGKTAFDAAGTLEREQATAVLPRLEGWRHDLRRRSAIA